MLAIVIVLFNSVFSLEVHFIVFIIGIYCLNAFSGMKSKLFHMALSFCISIVTWWIGLIVLNAGVLLAHRIQYDFYHRHPPRDDGMKMYTHWNVVLLLLTCIVRLIHPLYLLQTACFASCVTVYVCSLCIFWTNIRAWADECAMGQLCQSQKLLIFTQFLIC